MDDQAALSNPGQANREMPDAHPVQLLVAYDISDGRRRNRLHRLLRGFGEPLQKSVFVCCVDGVRRRRLEAVLEQFRKSPHQGSERIDCVVAHGRPFPGADHGWIIE